MLYERTKYDGSTLHFWRIKDKAEVDFVINKGGEVIPVEVKCKELKGKTIERSLKGFISKYMPKEAWIVNIGLRDEEKIGNTRVRYMPFYELL